MGGSGSGEIKHSDIIESIISYTCHMLDVSDGIRTQAFWDSIPPIDRKKLQKALQAIFDVNQKYVKKRGKDQ